MNPVGAPVALHDDLVEFHAGGLGPARHEVAEGAEVPGGLQVCGVAPEVRRGGRASNGGVQGGAAVAGGHADGLAPRDAQGVEQVVGQLAQVVHNFPRGGVVDVSRGGGVAAQELGEGEVGRHSLFVDFYGLVSVGVLDFDGGVPVGELHAQPLQHGLAELIEAREGEAVARRFEDGGVYLPGGRHKEGCGEKADGGDGAEP